MDAERWQRMESLFHRAADLDPEQRARFLAEACDDPGLRAEVATLLERDATGDDAFSRLDRPRERSDPWVGRTLGPWRLCERLAAGGMGVVYRAQRADGVFEQEVAVKLIRSERATEGMLARFESERRVLAALEHPSIARVLDGGSTPEGVPYFVMEFVAGERIDRYCAAHGLGLRARLELFVAVCRAVQFAHRNLVVHCDLKPANILIDRGGRPRLLDFGIARWLGEDGDGARAHTLTRVLTPEYASPEQLSGGPVSTAIDVYALGVVLYELSTAARPFQHDSRSPAEWERIVREVEPARPSTSVARSQPDDAQRLAQGFSSSPRALQRALRGDIDRIILMALRKEPERRYASVQELADDVERHLRGHPVKARPDSVGYRASKFVGRNRVAVLAASVVVAALVWGLLAARNGRALASAEARHATLEADSFQSVSNFLMDAFLPQHPDQDAAWQARARASIQQHAQRVRRQYVDSAHVQANMLDVLGHVARRLDLVDDAQALIEEARDLRERTFGRRSLDFGASLRSSGQLDYQRGRYAAAAESLQQALDLQRSIGGPHADVASYANDLAACLRALGRLQEASALHREALALRRAQGARSLPVAESLNNLASVELSLGNVEAALADLTESLALRESILGEDNALTLQTVSNLASVHWNAGHREEAERWMQRAEEGTRRLGGDGEDALALVLANRATMDLTKGAWDAAAERLDEALEIQTRRLGPDHPQLANTLKQRAQLSHARGRVADAREEFEESLRILTHARVAPAEVAAVQLALAALQADTGDCDGALASLDAARENALDSESAVLTLSLGRAESALGFCLQHAGRAEEAREHLARALSELRSELGATAEERARLQSALADGPPPARED